MSLTYRLYRLISGLRHHVPRQLTRPGLLLFGGMIIAGSASFDMDKTVAYQAFALQFCLLATAFLCKRFFRGEFRVTRHLPRFASVGHPFRYEVQVRNASKHAFRDLEIFEDLADPRPTREEFRQLMRPEEQVRSFRRYVKRGPFQDRGFRRATIAPAPLPSLPANAATDVSIEVLPLRRGSLRFESVSIGRPDALGLARGFKRVPLPQSVLVLPKRYPLPALSLSGQRKYQPGGVALAASIGESEEFVSLRDYRPGDPMRHIHWRSWARLGRPIVREYQDEFLPRHALILDTFATASQDTAFEEAVSIAASFACTIETRESLLDLLFVGPQAIRFTTGRGLGQAEQALEVLASVQRNPQQSFETLHHLVLQHATVVCGCVCVFVAWDEPRRELVRQLRQFGLPVLALVVGANPAKAADAAAPADGVHFLAPGRIGEGLLKLEGAA